MRTKFACVCSAVILAMASAGAASAQEFSFNAAVTSDYVWRGASQSNEDAAIQGGVDFTAGSFYAGTWASSVDFGDGTDAEWDFYLGFAPSMGGLDWDFGVTRYTYVGDPDGSDYDFTEFSVGLARAVGEVTVGAKVAYSPDFYGAEDEATYLEGSFEFPAAANLTISGAVGHQWVESGADYISWNLGGTYALNEVFGLDVRYHDSGDRGWGPLYDGRVSVSLTAGF